MVRRLRLAFAATGAVVLMTIAAVVATLNGGANTAWPLSLVASRPAVAANSRSADAPLSPVRDETASWTTAPTTAAPATTVTPRTTLATAPQTPAATTPPVPRTMPSTPARPAATTPPSPAPPIPAPPVGGAGAADFTLLGYRWALCHVVTVSSSGPDVAGIVNELASITGLQLQIVSGTSDITVGWGAVPGSGGEIGLTTWRAVNGWLSQAGIVISQQGQPYLATALRHELGHALGLGHASAPNEIMYGSVGRGSPTDYQAGDRAGLKAIGASAHC
ncbi:MAG: matrixin family metalloprotease [Actinomycetota bacterium]|nr:matrixin family metalloprotease [Actinomycetota bacterium]